MQLYWIILECYWKILIDYIYIYIYRGFHNHGGTPIAGWFISGKIPSRMDDDSGVALLQETPN